MSADPNASKVLEDAFFVREEEWEQARSEGYEFIIIGSSFCALGFATELLQRSPDAKILLLERGGFLLPDHVQNLHPIFKSILRGTCETFPWQFQQSPGVELLRGILPFFGGKSLVWSGWCPKPCLESTTSWPLSFTQGLREFLEAAEDLLQVVSSSEVYKGELQAVLKNLLDDNIHDKKVMFAPLAMGGALCKKFCTAAPLLSLAKSHKNFKIATNCLVYEIVNNNGTATALKTSRGEVKLYDTNKLVLCMGAIPSTALVLNSFPTFHHIGKTVVCQFISSLVARVPREDYKLSPPQHLELSALYIEGQKYHIQVTGMDNPDPGKNKATATRLAPDLVANPTEEQMQSSKEGFVILVCIGIGEFGENTESGVERTNGDHLNCDNIKIHVKESKADQAVKTRMEDAMQDVLRALSPQGRIDFWDSSCNKWKKTLPGDVRSSIIINESSTMPIEQSVDINYQLKGTNNVFLTGNAILPIQCGSWNPTLTIVALARHLGAQLANN
ncbi:uncharacterized protein LOC9648182 [Selaginella moellendorffii]|uniref:uncharacterized protein LOC9648182 n=1 Tax=Selaginella moellendorffii TaxID=88036 RepID=UPI000D1CB010|nr:uncharacterized protein LOC9648182 [Selaginella moellendorffii]|eukprot:XP_024541105.1 uncharacterized protein LOC9648182 [Selaginella moellendorffii]